MKEIYQNVYDTRYRNYGEAAHCHCPGVRLFLLYKKYLSGNVIDLGCGTGDTVRHLRSQGYESIGVDWVDLGNGMIVHDITEPIVMCKKYETCLCMDVIEHIPDEKLPGLFNNMKRCKRQIFSISNTPSIVEFEGKMINTHVNDKPFTAWIFIILQYFNIILYKKVRDCQYLFVCEESK